MHVRYLMMAALLVSAAPAIGCQPSQSTASSSSAASPGTSPAIAQASDTDRAFIDGMVPHHQMAVMMADDALKNGTHAELKTFAQQVKDDQSKEIDTMKAWRQQWFGSDTTPGMDHSMMTMIAPGADYDVKWAQEMIKHHQGAIDMSNTDMPQLKRQETKDLAQKIIAAQKAEQTKLQGWITAWSAK